MTAYAVIGDTDTFVTIINKEHGGDRRDVTVTIAPGAGYRAASSMALTAPSNNPNARDGITLGGCAIGGDGSWNGKWTPQRIDSSGNCAITIPATSAVVVKFSKQIRSNHEKTH